jgi:LysM repeat protein
MKDYIKLHHYKKNQSLEMLSSIYGVPVCMILKANGIKSDIGLKYDNDIKIPLPCYCERQRCMNSKADIDINDKCNLCENLKFFEYIIEKEETVFDIADKFNITVNILIRLNKFFKPESVKIGEKIKVPIFEFDTVIYKVCPTENFSDISDKFGISQQEIRFINLIKESESIYPSMRLILPKKES